jgi:hypothetical protein
VRSCVLFVLVFGNAAIASAADPAVFYRGINLNGPAVSIDGQKWDGNDAADFRCNGMGFENQSVTLKPPTDSERAQMIRSSRWGREFEVDLLKVPPGDYQVCLYVWEDNDSATYSLNLNGRLVLKNFASGAAGAWRRLGPWPTKPIDGVIRISARGGDANLSGLEIWSGAGEIPTQSDFGFVTKPTDEQLTFFESRIRPLLVKHCYECHSQEAKDLGGSLLLDSRSGILKGGDTAPPIVPGDPEASLLIKAVRRKDPNLQMPPDEPLSDVEVADLEQWVKMRSPDPRIEDTVAAARAKSTIDWDKARDFWSLRPLSAPSLPQVQDTAWVTNDIDRFVLAKLEAAGLKPTADAGKAALLRRVTYDLIGLPPSPDELAAFEADESSDAFAKVVKRLLDSPQYGEQWGRHWLDVVRYADTAGDNSDFPIPQMYRYRNWVIEAFNRDLPYDQFVREQLAGDLMGGATTQEAQQRLIATGYIANARRFGSRVDDYPQHLTIEDTLDNLGRTFLGTTINCARCHNHKFDPITTEDYYGLYGIFHSTRYPWPGIELEQKQRDLVPLVPGEEVQRHLAERAKRQGELDARVKELEKKRDAANGDDRKALDKDVESARKEATKHSQTALPFEQAYAVAEGAMKEDVAVQQKGDPAKLGAMVPRHFLTVLGGATLPETDQSSGRQQLADWIVDPKNPLAARVMANRIWLYHFGRGLTTTPNDFGRQGKPPTHPELLDYLATELIRSGWSIKSLHRQIVLSHTYRLSSRRDDTAVAKDPANELLSAFPRRRLDAEAIRDTLLLLGGHLDASPGGAHPFPPQTDWGFTQHNPFKAVYDTNRRSVYLMTQRIQRHPYLAIFDGPDPSVSTPQRNTSTTPLQALYLLNDPFVHDQTSGLANRLIADRDSDSARIERLYLLALARKPTDDERSSAIEFLSRVRAKLGNSTSREQLDQLAWQALVRATVRLNEFVYID